MPKFKCLQKKQNSDQLISDSQGAKSTHSFLQSTSSLPPHQTTSFLATTHSVPLFQPTLQAPPIFQPVSQSSQSVDSASHSATMDQLMSQLAPTAYPTSQPSHLVHSTSHPASTEQDSSQQVPTVQALFKKCIGRESQSYWTVEAIDSENNVKRLKVKKTDVLNLSVDELIVVNFDYLNEPFGEARSLLSDFCGILACDCSLFPINFEKWSSVPMSYLNRVFDQIIKPKFSFKTTESNARQHIYKSIGKKWAANKNNLWKLVEDPLKSKVEIIDNVPDGIPRDQWISLLITNIKIQQRKCVEEILKIGKNRQFHTQVAETGQRPGRAQIYIATHKNKDGVYVNEAAKEICEKIELTLSQSTMDESQISPNDAVGKVLGKEHSGRVRCLGLGVVPSKIFKQVRPRFGGASV
ncbi:uncharacterized protein [Solanum tuberosum]|uniref:uncharacterized protein n=1 Tax=Solanum tuberosum TaxID=4113 RepID=UPI00073A38AF|nr:PREDICTED: uncharacterized protein LOC107060004 [Solanum tuberosum]